MTKEEFAKMHGIDAEDVIECEVKIGKYTKNYQSLEHLVRTLYS